MGNKFHMKKIFQVLFCAAYFLLGLETYFVFDGGTGGTTQGQIISIAFSASIFWLGTILLSAIALFVLWKKKADWYIAVAVAPCALILGIAIGISQDLVLITPAEYGERGWAWAVGKYGAWRVLK